MYLLDTNILIEFMHGNERVIEHIVNAGIPKCSISIISIYELFFGAHHAPKKYKEQELARVEKIYSHFDVKPLPINANIYASAKQYLIENGQAIDDFDILIAATAIDSNITVVTDNEKHFNRIPNLKIENWLR